MNRPQESPKLFGHNRRRFMQVAARHLRKQILCGGAQHSVNVARLLCQPSEKRIPSHREHGDEVKDSRQPKPIFISI